MRTWGKKSHHAAMRQLDSPHHNARPDGVNIDLIVFHAISLPPGEFGMDDVEALFTDQLDVAAHASFAGLNGLHVSAHFVVDRHGVITQFVPIVRRAWHAGESEWEGRADCNDYSIGIEIIGDEAHPFTNAQYREAARLCRVLMEAYPGINAERIVGHVDIAPGRKWDPGKLWDWGHFHRSLAHIQRLDLELRQ
ncbi:MAG: 1,6-anhydro-N-acetylmuramyl-L-alanine amidase AmpD [Mariprofundaceae bacterium]|nr:1,6-anhydro-N-acetylmuramyl-L-alanine amidase AmpD [Mariprofundaceae bacterium]